MEQESISKKVGIIGAGPSGCACAKFLQDSGFDITLFDKGNFLRTILPTGGGRCNLSFAENNYKNLASNYPRGEKFLYSLFSRFSPKDSVNFFKSIGVETYVQDDLRIFPKSNSSKEVQQKLLNSIKFCRLVKENIIKILPENNKYKIVSNKNEYIFDYLIVSTGGHGDFSLLENIGINIIAPVQSLVGLVTEQNFSSISGVSLKNTCISVDNKQYYGDMIFTHKGISGPLVYKISSIHARKDLPYKINLHLTNNIDLQMLLNKNPHKEIKNLLGQFIPHSLGNYLLNYLNINPELKCHLITKELRNNILSVLKSFEINIMGKIPDNEVVTCGGIDLKEVNPKTMESKKYKNLYFCGEVLDIDGFCGGFNLQNCWSSAYVCANAIINSY